jgi:hypothetical protein
MNAVSKIIIGVDLGCEVDPSAMAIAEQYVDPAGRRHYNVRHLERWPLGTSYFDIGDSVARLTYKLDKDKVHLILDATGVGAAVSEIIRQARPQYKRFVCATLTGGRNTTWEGSWCNVPKRSLISSLQASLQGGRLHFATGLRHTQTLIKELREFRYKVNPLTGNESFEAWRESTHDDLTLALAMAVWLSDSAFRRVTLAI